jgi:hypothetical protein
MQIHRRELQRVQLARLACDARAVLIAFAWTDDEKLTDIHPEILLSAAPAILVRGRRRFGLRTPAKPVPSTRGSDARDAKRRQVRRGPVATVRSVRPVDQRTIALPPIAEPMDLFVPRGVLIDRNRRVEPMQI